jgi:hypothetical protein
LCCQPDRLIVDRDDFLIMQTFIRISSILMLLASLIWLAISPSLQLLFIFLIAVFLLVVTFVEFSVEVKKILTGLGLLGSALWVVLGYQNAEPYVALLSSALAYISINSKSNKNVRGTMSSKDDDNIDNHNIPIKPSLLDQKHRELKQQWEGLTARIQAITDDLAIEMDRERKHTLQVRLSRHIEDREKIESLMRDLKNKME